MFLAGPLWPVTRDLSLYSVGRLGEAAPFLTNGYLTVLSVNRWLSQVVSFLEWNPFLMVSILGAGLSHWLFCLARLAEGYF